MHMLPCVSNYKFPFSIYFIAFSLVKYTRDDIRSAMLCLARCVCVCECVAKVVNEYWSQVLRHCKLSINIVLINCTIRKHRSTFYIYSVKMQREMILIEYFIWLKCRIVLPTLIPHRMHKLPFSSGLVPSLVCICSLENH